MAAMSQVTSREDDWNRAFEAASNLTIGLLLLLLLLPLVGMNPGEDMQRT
jgi:hypothetical protein